MKARGTTEFILFLTALVLVGGTIGFSVIYSQPLHQSFIDTLYVLLTHFRHEYDPLPARIVGVSIVLAGFIIIAYTVRWFIEQLIGGTLEEKLEKKRMAKKISALSNHFIICGQGRVGRQVAEELENEGTAFVVMDRDANKLTLAKERGWLYLVADSTEDETLEEAGIAKAQALITALGQDEDNLVVTLTARSLNKDILIIARANNRKSEHKLLVAGANRVSLPHLIGGYYMASMAVRPTAADFCDVVLDSKRTELVVDGVVVDPEDRAAGKTVAEILGRIKESPASVLAINRKGKSIVNPQSEEVLRAGDTLILMGTKEALTHAKKLFV